MKLVRFTTAKHKDGVYGLVGNDGTIRVIFGGLFDPVLKTGEIVHDDDIVRYLVPVDAPNVLAIGRNFREHAAETASALPTAPLLFIKATTCLTAHQDNIVLPATAPDNVDYEAELVVVIGKAAKNVSVEDALDYVFGYTCGHDVSARDCQKNDGQWARAKSFDTFGPVGPQVVTGLDPSTLRVQLLLNGEVMQDQPASDMVFDVPYLVSYLSRAMTLAAGTLIFTGTPSGIGMARKPPRFLKPGDICEVKIDGIGVLRNQVVAW